MMFAKKEKKNETTRKKNKNERKKKVASTLNFSVKTLPWVDNGLRSLRDILVRDVWRKATLVVIISINVYDEIRNPAV